ncbi:hypothetical protein ACWCL1_06440 [Ligilactobacillus sp. LYQ135]
MNKQWFRILLSALISMVFLTGVVTAETVERDHYSNQNLDLPLDQMGQQDKKQQTKNNNNQLFQTNEVGDIGKERSELKKQGKKTVFQSKSKKVKSYDQKDVFVKKVKSAKKTVDYTKQKQTKKKWHFSYKYVILIGILIGLGITFWMVRSEKREQRNSNHDRITE